MANIKGKTSTGFSFKVDSEYINDAEFLEMFADVQNGDVLGVFNIVKKILGSEQKNALYEHLRDKKGHVPIEKLTDELTDIFKTMNEADETKK